MVEKGRTALRNCEFRCNTSGIFVRQGAELTMENCKVSGSMVSDLKGEFLRGVSFEKRQPPTANDISNATKKIISGTVTILLLHGTRDIMLSQ